MADQRPTYPCSLIGYRSWWLRDDRLCPLTVHGRERPWQPAGAVATCEAPKPPLRHGSAPDPDCECGLYCYHDHSKLLFAEGAVCGAVAAWGDVQVHATGFRAEHAKVVAIMLPLMASKWQRKEVRRIAAIYEVPVCRTRRKLEQLASVHGQPAPTDLRPVGPDDWNTLQLRIWQRWGDQIVLAVQIFLPLLITLLAIAMILGLIEIATSPLRELGF